MLWQKNQLQYGGTYYDVIHLQSDGRSAEQRNQRTGALGNPLGCCQCWLFLSLSLCLRCGLISNENKVALNLVHSYGTTMTGENGQPWTNSQVSKSLPHALFLSGTFLDVSTVRQAITGMTHLENITRRLGDVSRFNKYPLRWMTVVNPHFYITVIKAIYV